jgi:hypothetical protein
MRYVFLVACPYNTALLQVVLFGYFDIFTCLKIESNTVWEPKNGIYLSNLTQMAKKNCLYR